MPYGLLHCNQVEHALHRNHIPNKVVHIKQLCQQSESVNRVEVKNNIVILITNYVVAVKKIKI